MLKKTKTILKAGLAVAVLATSVVTLPSVSQAAQVGASANGSYQVADNGNWGHQGGDWRIRHRFNGGGWNHNNGGGWNHNRPYYGYGYGYRGYGYDNNWGGVAAAGIIGLAAGAAIANSGSRSYAGDDYDSYCSARFKSFNPRTGTYTGYDGLQHRCVMR